MRPLSTSAAEPGMFAIGRAAARPDAHVIGVDGAAQVIALAKRKPGSSVVTWRVGLADALANADSSVDAVIMSLLLHHLAPPGKRRALGEVVRVLRPGGRVHIADWGTPPRSANARRIPAAAAPRRLREQARPRRRASAAPSSPMPASKPSQPTRSSAPSGAASSSSVRRARRRTRATPLTSVGRHRAVVTDTRRGSLGQLRGGAPRLLAETKCPLR
jgi:SAM-dependent methyltransferase